jgi:hypothetical protein
LFRFQKFFVSLLFRFVFASFHFRFASDAKTSEKTLYDRSEKNSLPFRFISLRSKNDGSFSLPFRFISLRSENDGSFSLLFRFISSRSENYGSFSLLFRFVFASFHFVLLQISTFRIDAKQAKKHFFSHRIANKILFHLASMRFEAKMPAHPTFTH